MSVGYCTDCDSDLGHKSYCLRLEKHIPDIIEVAKRCGFIHIEESSLQAFADHCRKEGAEEANKTIENLRAYAKHERSLGAEPFAIELQSVKQQLAATELVVEKMREALNESNLYIRNTDNGGFSALPVLKKNHAALRLKLSLSSLREHEVKVIEIAKSVAIDIAEDWSQWVEADCAPHTNKGYMSLEFDNRMASELRAKGEIR